MVTCLLAAALVLWHSTAGSQLTVTPDPVMAGDSTDIRFCDVHGSGWTKVTSITWTFTHTDSRHFLLAFYSLETGFHPGPHYVKRVVYPTPGQGFLTLYNVSERDNGTYQCICKSQHRLDSKYSRIHVYEPPEGKLQMRWMLNTIVCYGLIFRGNPPVFLTIQNPDNQTVAARQDISVAGRVTTSGVYRCVVRWATFPKFSVPGSNQTSLVVQVPELTTVQASVPLLIIVSSGLLLYIFFVYCVFSRFCKDQGSLLCKKEKVILLWSASTLGLTTVVIILVFLPGHETLTYFPDLELMTIVGVVLASVAIFFGLLLTYIWVLRQSRALPRLARPRSGRSPLTVTPVTRPPSLPLMVAKCSEPDSLPKVVT